MDIVSIINSINYIQFNYRITQNIKSYLYFLYLFLSFVFNRKNCSEILIGDIDIFEKQKKTS